MTNETRNRDKKKLKTLSDVKANKFLLLSNDQKQSIKKNHLNLIVFSQS